VCVCVCAYSTRPNKIDITARSPLIHRCASIDSCLQAVAGSPHRGQVRLTVVVGRHAGQTARSAANRDAIPGGRWRSRRKSSRHSRQQEESQRQQRSTASWLRLTSTWTNSTRRRLNSAWRACWLLDSGKRVALFHDRWSVLLWLT